jgi:hypothetical protein
MNKKLLFSVIWALAAACFFASPIQAKPTAPVTFDYVVRRGMVSGDTVSTTLTVRGDVDLDQLTVSIAAYQGTELPGGAQSLQFDNLFAGSSRKITFDVTLTAAAVGYVAVTARTVSASGRLIRQKVITIRYGDHPVLAKPAAMQEGENLYEMQGSERP